MNFTVHCATCLTEKLSQDIHITRFFLNNMQQSQPPDQPPNPFASPQTSRKADLEIRLLELEIRIAEAKLNAESVRWSKFSLEHQLLELQFDAERQKQLEPKMKGQKDQAGMKTRVKRDVMKWKGMKTIVKRDISKVDICSPHSTCDLQLKDVHSLLKSQSDMDQGQAKKLKMDQSIQPDHTHTSSQA